MSNISRHYQDVSCSVFAGQIHYRKAGEQDKPVLMMLHPSPLSSAFLQALIIEMSQHFLVIAPDSPGYGQSDALTSSEQGLKPYVEVLTAFIDALTAAAVITQPKVAVYGNATGAQIAIEFCKAQPQYCQRLLLENACWFYDDEVEQLMSRYFPDLTPTDDGRHIECIADMCRRLFTHFPWFDNREQARFSHQTVSAEVLQLTMNEYLRAGKDYARAYKAAMLNEKPEQLAQVHCATDIVVWRGSPVYKYCQRLAAYGFANHIRFHHVEGDMQHRIATLHDIVR
ncbi:alpha/beta fold hydrolase [Thalassotalea sp. HSM 43]|uniref:alpha/beta fold hydrolase n=1 Tax=Thalassotalea sp. HSM 43 TaxID=2552945 RepID=UPI0016728CD6|nr:alpha/beta hydrolase [Thalassotalea sp. HSM 43]